jgi:hypothetical protein
MKGEFRGGSEGFDDVSETERARCGAWEERCGDKVGAAADADEVVAGLSRNQRGRSDTAVLLTLSSLRTKL